MRITGLLKGIQYTIEAQLRYMQVCVENHMVKKNNQVDCVTLEIMDSLEKKLFTLYFRGDNNTGDKCRLLKIGM